jgi:hypothetical protein
VVARNIAPPPAEKGEAGRDAPPGAGQ